MNSGTEVLQQYAAPHERARDKEIDHLDAYCIQFIQLSPFAVLSTADAAASPDLSPRGGPPGFIRVRDEHTLLLPDRPGNNRLDSLRKVADNPRIALLFLVPGVEETLRVYGSCELVAADELASDMADHGRAPRSALVVHVTHAFFHCAKALMRSGLWDQQAQLDRADFPTMGELMRAHAGTTGPTESQEKMRERYAAGL